VSKIGGVIHTIREILEVIIGGPRHA
jgi:hypothetical protein